jgi:hypothetical protein
MLAASGFQEVFGYEADSMKTTMYDRIAKHHYSLPEDRQIVSQKPEAAIPGSLLFYAALAASIIIYVGFLIFG